MSGNLQKVFHLIKKRCEKEKRLSEIYCFEQIARDAGISLQRLSIYLDQLKDKGLITFSVEHQFIYLTKLGKDTPASLSLSV